VGFARFLLDNTSEFFGMKREDFAWLEGVVSNEVTHIGEILSGFYLNLFDMKLNIPRELSELLFF